MLVTNPAPDFTATTVLANGSIVEDFKLSENYGEKGTVLFFYPLDFTFVCPTEITAYSKRYEEFKNAGAEIMGVSVDSEHSHKAWINNGLGKLNFSLASDITKTVSKEYGVLIEEDGIALRGLFIINPKGEIKYSVIHDLNVGRSVDETLRVLKALKTGGLCPIDWNEGQKLL